MTPSVPASPSPPALPSAMELRRELIKELPRDAFKNDPGHLVVIVAHTVIFALGAWYAARLPATWMCAAVGVVMGHSLFCLGNMCHYLSHHTIIRNPRLAYPFEAFFWGVALHSATVWTKTHNGTHHSHTNGDGDTFRRFTVHERRWDRTFMHSLFFPHRRAKWNPLVFLAYIVIYKAFEVTALFGLGRDASPMGPLVCRYSARERLLIVVELAWLYGLQYLIYRYLGGPRYLVTMGVAYIVGNGIATAYLHTQHGLMPLSLHGDNNPLTNSANVRTRRWVTRLHNHVAYHIEHHLFPSLNHDYAPLVANLLQARYGRYYVAKPLASAWRELFTNDLYKVPVDEAAAPSTPQRGVG